MSIIIDKSIRTRLQQAFPKSFINMQLEFICYPRKNTYFLLEDVVNEKILTCKILEWLSREASKSFSRQSQSYHLNGINQFLSTDFSKEDMEFIYTYLGNSINRQKTIEFIDSGFSLNTLNPEEHEG